MRVRFKLGTAMVAIAVTAIAVKAGLSWKEDMRKKSELYKIDAIREEMSRKVATYSAAVYSDGGKKEKAAAAKKAAVWHTKRRDFYKAAVKRPWMTIPLATDKPTF